MKLAWVLGAPLLSIFAVMYWTIIWIRNRAFDIGLLKSKSLNVPIISIGNITSGGTGKTPFTAYLIEQLSSRGLKVGLVSRGYGGTESGPALVRYSGNANANDKALVAKRFGDEPSWFAREYPDVPVVVGAKRPAAVEYLLTQCQKENKIDLVIADDAFQHRWLKRDFDIVILDATELRWRYLPIPLGRAREGFSALNRAQAVIITRVNLAREAELHWLRREVQSWNLISLEMSAEITSFYLVSADLNQNRLSAREAKSFSAEKVFLFSGIGRPEAFTRSVEMATGIKILEHLVFSDHHVYTQADLTGVEEKALQLGATVIITTEKDAVKIADWSPRVQCWMSHLETRVNAGDTGAFYEAIHRLLI